MDFLSRPFKDIIKQIQAGFSWPLVCVTEKKLGLAQKQFATMLGISPRNLTRLHSLRRPLSPVASDRLYRAAQAFKLAEEVFEDEERARNWLRRPQRGLGGRIPFDILDTEPGFQQVKALLTRIEHGVLS